MTLAITEEQLVKSRQRVKAHGEVFTPRHMVEQMLDLVREDLETGADFVDKTFLEPAAGAGNFLVAILRRKLAAIEKRLPAETWPTESLFALASIYGIELLEDNHQDAKVVMLAEFHGFHQGHGTPCGRETDLHQAAAFLVEANIVRGNTLTSQTPRVRTSSSRGGTVSTAHRRWCGATRSPWPRCMRTTASTSPSMTATNHVGSTRSTRR